MDKMANMSTNLTNASTGPVRLDTSSFITDMVTNCASMFFGICSVVANGIILALGLFNKSLRKDGKRIQIALSIADLILGLGAIVQTIDKWRIQFWNNWYTAYYCALVGMLSFFGDALSLMFTLIMAIERLLAIWYPIWYRTTNKRTLNYSLIMSALFLVIVFCGSSFYGINGSVKPSSCTGSTVRIAPLKPLLSYYNFAVGSMVVMVYCTILYGLRVNTKTYINVFPTMALEEKELYKKESEATKVVTLVVVGCIIFFAMPNIIVMIVTWIKSDFQAGPYVSLLGLFQASLNFLLYMWKDKRMRRAFLSWFGASTSNTVSSTDVMLTRKQIDPNVQRVQ